ncbi:S-layer homology domain-containing protein, partial [Flavonifractor hominis]
YRYAGSPATEGSLTGFADASSVSAWAQDAMEWAVENGLISGMGDGTLNPQGEATRAQVAIIVTRFVSLRA